MNYIIEDDLIEWIENDKSIYINIVKIIYSDTKVTRCIITKKNDGYKFYLMIKDSLYKESKLFDTYEEIYKYSKYYLNEIVRNVSEKDIEIVKNLPLDIYNPYQIIKDLYDGVEEVDDEVKVSLNIIKMIVSLINKKDGIGYIESYLREQDGLCYIVYNNGNKEKIILNNICDDFIDKIKNENEKFIYKKNIKNKYEIDELKEFGIKICDEKRIDNYVRVFSKQYFSKKMKKEYVDVIETLDIIYPKEINEGIHTDKHEALSDEDKVVENLFELSKFCLKKLKIKFKEVNYIESHFEGGNMGPHYALLHSNEKIELDFYEHCDRDSDNKERLHENEAFPTKEAVKEDPSLLEVYSEDEIINEDRVNEKVKEKSRKYFSRFIK